MLRDGYIYIKKPDHPHTNYHGYIPEHRLVYEEFHKCCILSYIHVHHINGNRQDNRIQNLMLVTRAQHNKLEKTGHLKDMSNRKCIVCGSNKIRIVNGYREWYGKNGKWLCRKCYRKLYEKQI